MRLSLLHLSNWLLAALLALVALMAVDVLVGAPVPGALLSLWDWRLEGVELGAAAVCALRAVGTRRERLAWSLIAFAMFASACGDVYTDSVLAHAVAIPVPSPADALYLAFYPAIFIGLALLVRSRGYGFSANIWLDGVLSAFGVATIATALVFPAVVDTTGHATAAVVTSIAFPVFDTVLLGLVVGMIATTGRRPGRAWLLLVIGVSVWSAGDLLVLYQTAEGTYRRGSIVDLCYPIALVLLAVASRAPVRRVATVSSTGWWTLAVPAGFGAASLGLEVYDHFSRIHTVALLLSGVTILLVLVRLVVTFDLYLRLLGASRREAASDPLTGLANRRALAADLEEFLQSGSQRSAVILFDLDGFKAYNDTFGHPAGDALLQRLAARLVAAQHGGRVYRMGGDEFCVLAVLGDRAATEIARLCARALGDRGAAYEITSSYGLVVLPDETRSLTDAMRLADQRLYEHKGVGRRSQTGQTIDTLVRVVQARGSALEEHGSSVAELAGELAAARGLGEAECELIRYAAILHDLGKLALPDTILGKPGPLDHAEWEVMRLHPEIGQRMLGDSAALAPIGLLVRASHESYDGTGYPDGLAGTGIPLGARIVALCDAYHAMITTRCYREARTPAAAVAELRRCAGVQFDPELIEPFLRILDCHEADQVLPLAA